VEGWSHFAGTPSLRSLPFTAVHSRRCTPHRHSYLAHCRSTSFHSPSTTVRSPHSPRYATLNRSLRCTPLTSTCAPFAPLRSWSSNHPKGPRCSRHSINGSSFLKTLSFLHNSILLTLQITYPSHSLSKISSLRHGNHFTSFTTSS
jgi:hypothetical protein